MGIYDRRHHHPLSDAGAGASGGGAVWGDPFRYMASAPGCSGGGGGVPAAHGMAHGMEMEMELAEPKFEPAMVAHDVEALALQEAQLPPSPDSSDQEPARPGHKVRTSRHRRESPRSSHQRRRTDDFVSDSLA
jgi:hypothetical protein